MRMSDRISIWEDAKMRLRGGLYAQLRPQLSDDVFGTIAQQANLGLGRSNLQTLLYRRLHKSYEDPPQTR